MHYMNTNAIIGLVVAVVVVGAGVWYFGGNNTGENMNESMQGNEESQMGSGTFMDLMKLGGSFECTVSSEDPNSVSNGTVFVSGEKIRGDFTSTVNGTPYDTHFINADGFIYTWSSAMPQGMKMADQGMMEGEASPSEAPGSFDPSVKVDYECNPWMADAGKFTPPSDVSFMDFTQGFDAEAMMQMQGGQGIPQY